jgi:hypothetical protein
VTEEKEWVKEENLKASSFPWEKKKWEKNRFG